MNQPSAFDGLSFVILGTVLILARRPYARHIKASHDTFDRAYDEDGLAFWIAVMGGISVVIGATLFLLWATA